VNSLTIFLAISLVVSLFLLFISIYYNVKFGKLILRYVDQIEETLDVFDEKYSNISEIVEKPLFYDSLEVRAVVEDIKSCRDSVLKAANVLGNVEEEEV